MSSLITPPGGIEEVGIALEDTSLAIGVGSARVSEVLWLSGTWVMIRERRETSKILGIGELETPSY